MSRIDELQSLIRFYEEQLGEDEGDLYEEYESELVAAIDELNRLRIEINLIIIHYDLQKRRLQIMFY